MCDVDPSQIDNQIETLLRLTQIGRCQIESYVQQKRLYLVLFRPTLLPKHDASTSHLTSIPPSIIQNHETLSLLTGRTSKQGWKKFCLRSNVKKGWIIFIRICSLSWKIKISLLTSHQTRKFEIFCPKHRHLRSSIWQWNTYSKSCF